MELFSSLALPINSNNHIQSRMRFLVILFLVVGFTAAAQVENVIVERYYVSDGNDATDITGGVLPIGSVTYRIYVDLLPGSKLLAVYGDYAHPLEFASTENFFNNLADGQSFGKDFSKTRLGENTVALDSWITIGQLTRSSTKTYFGVLKADDTDGSFIGGSNNDGGSAMISSGLLANTDPSAGIPLTTADGNDTLSVIPTNWLDAGFLDPITGDDSTIFGSLVARNTFYSTGAVLANSGVAGKDPVKNQVLVAQLTTTGDLRFRLNVLVEEPGVPIPKQVKYVSELAAGETNSDTLKVAPTLRYPQSCGCIDPNYLEYSSSFACGNSDSCRTLVVLGCTDTMACNYDPTANFNIPSLCCYPGYCNDRDLAVVCPQLNLGRTGMQELMVLPNPVQSELLLQWISDTDDTYHVELVSMSGMLCKQAAFAASQGAGRVLLPVGELAAGIYVVRIYSATQSVKKLFVKE